MAERKIGLPFPEIPLYPVNKTHYLKGNTWVEEVLPAETRASGIIPASSEESLFYNQEFIPITDTIGALEDYLAASELAGKRQVIQGLVRKTLRLGGSFGQVMSTLESLKSNEKFSPHLKGFRENFLNSLGQESKTLGKTPTAEVVGEYLEYLASDSQYEPLARTILAGFFKEAKTQEKMVNLTYNLCVYALRGRNPEVEKLVAKILSYSPETHDILNPNSKNVREFSGGLFAQDDETLGKFHDVDETIKLLLDTYSPSDNKQYLETVEQIMNGNTNIPLEKSQRGDIGSRNSRISFFLRTVRSAQYVPSEREISIQDLIFPESVIYDTRRELRQLLADRQTEQHPEERKGKFYAPTGVYSYLQLHPNEEKPLSGLMRYALINRYKIGEPLTVTSNEARDCALNFIRPLNLFSTAQNDLRESRIKIKHRLREHFKYMLRPSGEKVLVMDKSLNEGLGIKSVTFFPGENFTHIEVQIQFGK